MWFGVEWDACWVLTCESGTFLWRKLSDLRHSRRRNGARKPVYNLLCTNIILLCNVIWNGTCLREDCSSIIVINVMHELGWVNVCGRRPLCLFFHFFCDSYCHNESRDGVAISLFLEVPGSIPERGKDSKFLWILLYINLLSFHRHLYPPMGITLPWRAILRWVTAR